MNLLLLFLVGAFVAGGSRRGRVLRARPLVALAFAALFASAYYRLGAIL